MFIFLSRGQGDLRCEILSFGGGEIEGVHHTDFEPSDSGTQRPWKLTRSYFGAKTTPLAARPNFKFTFIWVDPGSILKKSVVLKSPHSI